jgi:hypothetical protein
MQMLHAGGRRETLCRPYPMPTIGSVMVCACALHGQVCVFAATVRGAGPLIVQIFALITFCIAIMAMLYMRKPLSFSLLFLPALSERACSTAPRPVWQMRCKPDCYCGFQTPGSLLALQMHQASCSCCASHFRCLWCVPGHLSSQERNAVHLHYTLGQSMSLLLSFMYF